MSSSDRVSKHQFIESQLQESGHSQWLFAQFCSSEGFPDLENCPMTSLESLMSRFKSQYSASDTDVERPSKSGTGEYRVRAQMLAGTDLCRVEGRIRVRVTGGELVDAGFLLSPVMKYTVTTKPMNWVVKRSMSNFIWLHKILSFQFPGTYVLSTQIPPLPSDEKDSSILQDLTSFLDFLLRTDFLRYNHYLRSFLASESALFKGAMGESVRVKSPESVQEMWSMSGFVTCLGVGDEDRTLIVSEYARKMQELSGKLAKQFNAVCKASQALTREFGGLQEVIQELDDMQELVPEAAAHHHIYRGLREFIGQWTDTQNSISTGLRDYGVLHNQYYALHFKALSDFLYIPESLSFELRRNMSELEEKKEKMWAKGDPSRWDLNPANRLDAATLKQNKSLAFASMLYSKSEKIQVLSDKLAYFRYQSRAEFHRVIGLFGQVMSEKTSDFGRLVEEELQMLLDVWRTFQAKLTSVFS